MKEIKSIIKFFDSSSGRSERAALVLVVRIEGSSYRREGARMLVFESGIFEGGISGGCLEGDALAKCQIAILKQKPSIVTYDTSKDDEKQIGIGLGCNGIIDVLIIPLTSNSMSMKLLRKCISNRKSHIIITITNINCELDSLALGNTFYFDTQKNELTDCTHSGLETFIYQNVEEVLTKKKSKIYHFTQGDVEISMFIELIPSSLHLVIYGDNYDVYPMLELARVLGWEVSLVGNIQKLEKEKLQTVTNIYHKDFEEHPEIDDRTAIILMAHDFKTDCSNLKMALKTSAPYIAALGPKKRYTKMLSAFKDENITLSSDDQKRVFAPCGLEIGANTPEEIATSIFAEILAIVSKKQGGMLRDKMGTIHERHF